MAGIWQVLEKSTFFQSKRDSYVENEEMTVVYGSAYKRTYSTWGHAGVPTRYRLPGAMRLHVGLSNPNPTPTVSPLEATRSRKSEAWAPFEGRAWDAECTH